MTHPSYLVTGATGLIGGHLVRRLTEEGLPVRALVRRQSDVTALRECGVELVIGDLCDADSVLRAMKDVSHVFHCGALVTDWGSRRLFHQTNVDGTRHVVDAICLAGRVPQAIGRAMNICDDSPITWREYTDALAEAMQRTTRWARQ